MTFTHQFARLVLTEQIYRASEIVSIDAVHPWKLKLEEAQLTNFSNAEKRVGLSQVVVYECLSV